MTDIAIRVHNLSKLYPELSARACHLGAVHQRPNTLRDVSFEACPEDRRRIKRSEVVVSATATVVWQ